ncbi:hypothetical protein B7494_g2122 [Chlorociboria aeruginascens]|nr:hypothetical protein B7494_g2122 [Chlorociboria aeruginascens]
MQATLHILCGPADALDGPGLGEVGDGRKIYTFRTMAASDRDLSTTPTKAGAAKIFGGAKIMPLKGRLIDGVWHCNCDPRLPASHFRVRKEGPNTGRWFYTCQEKEEHSCGFFLWAEDARRREISTVLDNSRSESRGSTPTSNRILNKMTVEGHKEASNKFIADLARSDEDEFGNWPLSPEDERRVVQTTPPFFSPETPRKASKTDNFMTPGSKRRREAEAFPTPMTGGSSGNVLTKPSKTRKNGGMWDGNEPFGLGPAATPTPSRFRDPLKSDHHGESPQSYDISEEVMELLKGQDIDKDIDSKLREVLNRHALKISGIARGRDITRVALKSKDSKIADLQQKIATLESQREMDIAVIKRLKRMGSPQ